MRADESIPPGDSTFAVAVRIDKVQLLYRQSADVVLASLIGGGLWAGIVWQGLDDAGRSALTLWLLALAIASALRLGLFFGYRRSNPQHAAVLPWLAPYVVTLMLSSLVWGIGTLLVVPTDSPFLLVVTYVFIIGLSGSALSAYGVFIWLAVLVICTVLLPIVFLFMSKGETTAILLAIAGFWSFIASMRGVSVHSAAMDESFRLAHELRDATRVATLQAQTDGLTGLKNRRAFGEAADAVLRLVARERQQAAMLVIDVDDFKQINDVFGHAAGDASLEQVARLLERQLRRSDICGRAGGDEFVVLLPNTTVTAARAVAEKLCKAAASNPVLLDGKAINISLSIGIATGDADCDAMLRRADSAMYEAKRNGKNQVAAG
jgi:diguanylate cyclase (GGDEF)-like protein